MANDLFQADQSEVPVDVKFEELVGEGKKYSDQEAVAHALIEKDRFIERLKQEAAEARQAATSRLNEDQFLDKLEQRLRTQSQQVAPQEDPAGHPVNTGLTEEDVTKLLEQRDAGKRRTDNLGAVAVRLQGVYGSNWKAHVAKLAQELGVGTQYLTNLASDAPALFYNAIGLKDLTDRKSEDTAPPRSSIQSFAPSQSNAKDYAFWTQQRQEKGEAWYFNATVQQQIWKELKAMGDDKFYARSPNQI